MHGAAVVIDVPTGEVRALVSVPTFNLNTMDSEFNRLLFDDYENPLFNRATQSQFEPGSTVKPIIGLGAIAQGLLGLNEGIECTGFLILNGHKLPRGRCWTTSKAGGTMPSHHIIPTQAPHQGHDGNADGFLTFSDALERSCNVFFETVADRLKIEGVSYWMDKFGLGRPTGIGIAEACGRTPIDYNGPNRIWAGFSAGIGQGFVAATPIQMANVAATVARGGIWMRPRLVIAGQATSSYIPARAADASEWANIPDRVDLQLPRDAIAAAQLGMKNVVNSRAGTGPQVYRSDIVIAAKTGTAQAAPTKVRVRLEGGGFMKNAQGRDETIGLRPSTHDNPNPQAPWYRGYDDDGKNLKHAWVIGFAPADNPKLAFAVMVEYGGSGGTVAGPIAAEVIESLVKHGYLQPRGKAPVNVAGEAQN
jgi:penicillin-binding protein 2